MPSNALDVLLLLEKEKIVVALVNENHDSSHYKEKEEEEKIKMLIIEQSRTESSGIIIVATISNIMVRDKIPHQPKEVYSKSQHPPPRILRPGLYQEILLRTSIRTRAIETKLPRKLTGARGGTKTRWCCWWSNSRRKLDADAAPLIYANITSNHDHK